MAKIRENIFVFRQKRLCRKITFFYFFLLFQVFLFSQSIDNRQQQQRHKTLLFVYNEVQLITTEEGKKEVKILWKIRVKNFY